MKRVRIPVPDGLIKASTALPLPPTPSESWAGCIVTNYSCDKLPRIPVASTIAKRRCNVWWNCWGPPVTIGKSPKKPALAKLLVVRPHHAPPHHRMDPPPHERVGVMSSQLDPYIRTKRWLFGPVSLVGVFARGELWIAGVAGGC